MVFPLALTSYGDERLRQLNSHMQRPMNTPPYWPQILIIGNAQQALHALAISPAGYPKE
jgi:hypothetical protein